MRSRLVVVTAIAALLAAPLHAQDPFQLTFGLSEATERSVLLTIRMRNTQGKNALDAFSLYGAHITPGERLLSIDDCTAQSGLICDPALFMPENPHWDGAVKTDPFSMKYSSNPLNPLWVTVNYGYGSGAPGGDMIKAIYGPTPTFQFGWIMDPGDVTWGLIGCTLPVAYGQTATNYKGQNCIEDGYDGWFEFGVRYRYDNQRWSPSSDFANVVDFRELTVDDFTVIGFGAYTRVVTPEPATYALTVAGLVGLGITSRRRRSATRHAGEPKA